MKKVKNLIKQNSQNVKINKDLVIRNDLIVYGNVNGLNSNLNISNTLNLPNVGNNFTQTNQDFDNELTSISNIEFLKTRNLQTNSFIQSSNDYITFQSSILELNSSLTPYDVFVEHGIRMKLQDDRIIKFVWTNDINGFIQKDDSDVLLKMYFDTTHMGNTYLRKGEDSFFGQLILVDITEHSNSFCQQNFKYLKDTIIDVYSNHTHSQYIHKWGETEGYNEGRLIGHLTLSDHPILPKHQTSKGYIDQLQDDSITLPHPQYITLHSNDEMDLGQSLSLHPTKDPVLPIHQQPFRYMEDRFFEKLNEHNHNDLYISTVNEGEEVTHRIPRLGEDFYLKVQEIEKDDTHIQSKEYVDFYGGKTTEGMVYITYVHYLLKDIFKNNLEWNDDECEQAGKYRLTFDFTNWYNDFNEKYKTQFQTEHDLRTLDFIVLPIITPSSFEHSSSADVLTLDSQSPNSITWFNDDEYYDIFIENLTYPEYDKNFIVSVDLGVVGVDDTGVRTETQQDSVGPLQTFTLTFIAGPQNYMFNKYDYTSYYVFDLNFEIPLLLIKDYQTDFNINLTNIFTTSILDGIGISSRYGLIRTLYTSVQFSTDAEGGYRRRNTIEQTTYIRAIDSFTCNVQVVE